jgi:single-stranded-DNA-specific exonuclease
MDWNSTSLDASRCNWTTVPCDREAARRLSDALPIPEHIAGLLVSRGVAEPEAARRFLRPSLSQLGDPLLFPGMDEAARRIARAIAAGERIVVFGDFDADGVGACAILGGVLSELGAKADIFLPDRLSEGYGLTAAAWERCRAASPDVRLLVTVDCGITSAGQIDAIRAEGVDVVVTDHHMPGDDLPRGCILVNPHLGATPGSEHLCGAGVAFKLAHALVKRDKLERGLDRPATDLREYLDVVAVSTIADVVPLVGENRLLACAGLNRLRTRPSQGMFALMDKAGLASEEVGGVNVAFRLCPRINAAGRMGSALAAYELLTATDPDRARELAVHLDHRNAERHSIEQDVLDAARESLRARGFDPDREGAVVADGGADWHPGVLGIVASRLSEEFQRPAAVIAFDAEGNGRGSLRAGDAGDYDILAALSGCEAFLERFGGHRRAGGFGLRRGQLDGFREAFSAACRDQAGGAAWAQATLSIDGWLDPSEVSLEWIDPLSSLEPFGEGNPEPVWGFRGLSFASPPRAVGADGAHLQANFRKDGATLPAIGFGMGSLLPASLDAAAAGRTVDVVAVVQANAFNGSVFPQLNLRDLRISS